MRLVTHSQLKNLCNGNGLYVDNLVIGNMRAKHSLLSSIIIINIIAIGAYPRDYNCITIYHVSCYFKREFAERSKLQGLCLSNQIVSSVMAQVAEEKDINVVLSELFSSEGS